MSVNHVLTKNNNKTNWMTANNLENVVYKLSGNGKNYVFSNPNSFAKFLGQNKNSLNNYLSSLNKNANITIKVGNVGGVTVRGPFGPIKPRQIQKVRLVGNRNASAPVNLQKLMANMRFTKQAPNISTQNTSESNARNRISMINAVIRALKEGLNSRRINLNSNPGQIRGYLEKNKGLFPSFALNNEDILNLRNVVNIDPNLNTQSWLANYSDGRANRTATRTRRAFLRRIHEARAAVRNRPVPARLFGSNSNTNNTNRFNWRQRTNAAIANQNTSNRTFTNLLRNWHARYRFGASNVERQLATSLINAQAASWRRRANTIFQQARNAGPNVPANVRNRARRLGIEISSTNGNVSNANMNMAARLMLI